MSDKKTGNGDEINPAAVLLVLAVMALILWSKYRVSIIMTFYRWILWIRIAISLSLTLLIMRIRSMWNEWRAPSRLNKAVLGKRPDGASMLAGTSADGKQIYLSQSERLLHTQVVGGTGSGKTESTICPMAVDDIKNGRGLIVIDGKSDRSLLDKLYAYAVKYGRVKDFKILSLADTSISNTFNPFAGGDVAEVTERVFGALNFENEYYKSIQIDALTFVLLVLKASRINATPQRVIELLRDTDQMTYLARKSQRPELIAWSTQFTKLSSSDRETRTSGLISQLQTFVLGEMGQIFNSDVSDIVLERAMENNEIIYCQLPAMKIPSLGKAAGKMILQSLQSAISSRHLGRTENRKFFSVYLDDFTEYLTPSFVTLLNKSRSANVGIVFAHQALGDLDVLGDGLKNSVLTNSNLKVFMKTNEPASAEYFASVIGTTLTDKVTERQVAGMFGSRRTGDGSVRAAEEFKHHPNLFKQTLGVGEAVLVLPHSSGSMSLQMKFYRLLDLPPTVIPQIPKLQPIGLPALPEDFHIKKNGAPVDGELPIEKKPYASNIKSVAKRGKEAV